MAILGKRKAPEPAVSPEEAQEIFRRHFEAQFQPIRDRRTVAASDDETDGDSDEDDATEGSTDGDESEWGGLSNDEISDDGGGGL
jgi:hypothetical protein